MSAAGVGWQESPRLSVAQGVTGARTVSADRFASNDVSAVSGQHVLVLDDTWTTGAKVHSAALAARRAGAAAVTVMVEGRWLRAEFGSNAESSSGRGRW
jgi:hypothetical protein